MCGIAGLIELNGTHPIDHPGKVLRQMLDQLRHRGPDDRGEEKFEEPENGLSVYLGHQRLSIIDLSSNGHQPMANDSKSIWISTNSEIYNFRELREELSAKYHFHSNSDTEVLLKAYEEWGVGCLHKLRGMFAFAIWDSPRKSLFLARDRLGVKPLYYFSNKDYFLFASELRAILASGIVPIRLNPTGLFHYFSFGSLQGPDTLLDSIQELEPAHYLLVSRDSVKKVEYWNPTANVHEVFKEDVECLLSNSVKIRLVSDVPLGAFLSGGIDSSAIVSFMKQDISHDLNTLSIIFKELDFDESFFSDLVAKQFETHHQTLELSEGELIDSLPHTISSMDQPTVDGINTWFISRCARQAGWKVALSGIGGDELFGGYDSFRLIPKLTFLQKSLGSLPRFGSPLLSNLLKNVLKTCDRNTKLAHLFQGKTNGAHIYFLFRALFCEDQIHSLFLDQTLFLGELETNLRRTKKQMQNIAFLDPLKQISYLELTNYLRNTLLRDTDMMSMAHGLEVRVPFIDHRFVEKMFSLPTEIQFARPNKSLLLQSLPYPLPDQAVHRKKMGFTLPFESWMRNKLRGEVESVLNESVPLLSEIISEKTVKQIWDHFLNRKTSWTRAWSLYVLKKWIVQNLNNSSEG